MFAKVFGQIFDSSIAEDYNCRRMFMDLLVLADPTGAVDMTPEAISRRTNVPLEEVNKYIAELCQPDPASRSQLEEGKRIVPLDPKRDWGWQIVNYPHYRKLKDQEALRTYFREAQRRRRAKLAVKDKGLTKFDNVGQSLTNLTQSVYVDKKDVDKKKIVRTGESTDSTTDQTREGVKTDSFDLFWTRYPNKQKKLQARSAWSRIKPKEHEAIFAGLEVWLKSPDWQKDAGQYVPHPSTFLNQRRWEDLPKSAQVEIKRERKSIFDEDNLGE